MLQVGEMFKLFNSRSLRTPLHRLGFLSNPFLIVARALTILVQIAAVYAPPLQAMLKTVPLSPGDWLLLLALAAPLLVVGEAYKLWRFKARPSDS